MRSSGMSMRQRGITCGQRVWKRQPGGGASRLGTSPPSTGPRTRSGSARGTAVRDALLAKGSIDPARVFLTTNEVGENNKNTVRLELKLR